MRCACRAVAVASLLLACCSGTRATTPSAEFVVAVGRETFVMRTTDPETTLQAQENLRGANRRFPIGPLRRGDGGFNAPWSWHLDPDRVRMTEAAIEVCDGNPSYVEAHLDEFLGLGYCPWGARVVAVRR